MHRFVVLTVPVVLLLLLAPGARAAGTSCGSATDRPRVGLVLSGGGARGAAHVGVLEVLEEMRVPIDCIAGTSMGSIVGGLYASGMRPAEISRALQEIDWTRVFDDNPPRQERSFNRKLDDYEFLVKAKPGMGRSGPKLPAGLVQGQKLDQLLQRYTLPVADVTDFNQLAVPFRAVATDIATGREVVLGGGDLSLAIRASMAVPGAFAPVEINDKLLVDGGVANNLPVSVARAMGAQVVIAVDISTPLLERKKISSALSIIEQLSGILTRRNTEEQLATLGARDVLIVPDLGDITTSDFTRVGEAVPLGAAAARGAQQSLGRYALDQQAYLAHHARRDTGRAVLPVIHFVRVDNKSRLRDEVILSGISQPIGQPLDLPRLEDDLNIVYGLETMDRVSYDLVEENGKTGLVVQAKDRAIGPGYLQFGMQWSGDFDGESVFSAAAAYQRLPANSLGGEWRLGLRMGAEPLLGAEWHQPLDSAGRYFIEPHLTYEINNVGEFDSSGNQLSEYRVRTTGVELQAGREFGAWGELRVGIRRQTGELELKIGENPNPTQDFEIGEGFVRLSQDKLDNVNFPAQGQRATLEYLVSSSGLGADSNFDQASFSGLWATSRERHTLMGVVHAESTVSGRAPPERLVRGGGLFDLPGFKRDELAGQHFGSVGAIYNYRLGATAGGLITLYAGGSVEAGNVWQDRGDIKLDSLIFAGSAFFGADTPIGPFYLAYGLAEGGHSAGYLYLGRPY